MKPASKKVGIGKNISQALRQVLQEGQAGTQEAIGAALKKQGFTVNQSKISRLLNKVGAIKVNNAQGQTIYRLPHEHGLAHELQQAPKSSVVKQFVFDVASNSAMIVIYTVPGAAAMVARELDLNRQDLQILGCIAGDDTIFVAPKELKSIKQVLEGIKKLLID